MMMMLMMMMGVVAAMMMTAVKVKKNSHLTSIVNMSSVKRP